MKEQPIPQHSVFLNSTHDLTLSWNFNTNILHLSPSLQQLISCRSDEIKDISYAFAVYVHEMDHERIKHEWTIMQQQKPSSFTMRFAVAIKKQTYIWMQLHATPLYDEQNHMIGASAYLLNLEENEALDPLTGLLPHEKSKLIFENTVLSNAEQHGSFMILKIDDGSNSHVLYSQDFRKWMLRSFVAQLFAILPDYVTMSRYLNDQIILYAQNLTAKQMSELYDLINEQLTHHTLFTTWVYHFTVSAGIVSYPEDGLCWHDLLQHAAVALNKAKESENYHCIIYQKDQLTKQLHEAFINHILFESVQQQCRGFRVVYQPICDANTLEILGAEALLRFDAPNGQTMHPDSFLPFLDESSLIIQVGKWVLQEAIQQCKQWTKTNAAFKINVNLSYVQLCDADFSNMVVQLLHTYQLSPDHLVLELTESYFTKDESFISKILEELKQAGIRLAMDDFGTGYSSLARLSQFNVDIVKIDKLFVQSIQSNAYTEDFIGAVVRLCHNVGLKVCVEGVETRSEHKHISMLHTDYIQGYYVSRPMDADEFEKAFIQHQFDASLFLTPQDASLYSTQLNEDASFLQMLIDTMPLAMIIWDQNANIISCNHEALHLYDLQDENQFLENFSKLSPTYQIDGQLSKDKVNRKIQEAIEQGSARFAWQHLDIHGNTIPCEVICHRVNYHNTHIIISYTRDIREQLAHEQQSQKLNKRIRALLDAMPLCANLWNQDMRNIMCNKEAVQLFDLEDEDQYTKCFEELSPEFQPDGIRSKVKSKQMIQEAFQTGYHRFQWVHCKLNKEEIPCEITLVRINGIGDAGEDLVAGYTRDIREELRIAKVEKVANQRMTNVLNETPLTCLIWNADGYCIDCNLVALKLFEIDAKEELIYHFDNFLPLYQPDGARSDSKKEELMQLVKQEGRISFEWVYLNKNHENIPCEVTLVLLDSEEDTIIVAYSRDLRELKKTLEINERLSQLAYYDLLTNCESRSYFLENMQALLDKNTEDTLALLMLDIDHFKQINDNYGHEAGDITLKAVTSLIRKQLPEDAHFARYGGDEFLILLQNASIEVLQQLLSRLKTTLAVSPIHYGANVIYAQVSIGASLIQASHTDLSSLIKRSDQALYQAKKAGRNQSIIM